MTFDELPVVIIGSLIGAAGSALTALATFLVPLLGGIDPQVADEWGMRGILICSVVFLVGCIVTIVRWVMQQGVAVIRENSKALIENAESNRALNATNAAQNAYFEQIAKKTLDDRLNAPQVYVEPPTARARRNQR